MKPILRNIAAVIAGLIFGSLVNMGLIMLGGSIIPPPGGADVTTMDGLKNTMHLFGPENFLFPYLAHTLGTLAGALVTGMTAATHKQRFSLVIGALFLLGGSINVYMLPAPMWFNLLDLLTAYIPMGWIGGKLALKFNG